MPKRPAAWLALMAGLCVCLGACGESRLGSEPRNGREIAPGPGLFTGASGEFVLVRPEAPDADNQEETPRDGGTKH
jgi:hypothetical protein